MKTYKLWKGGRMFAIGHNYELRIYWMKPKYTKMPFEVQVRKRTDDWLGQRVLLCFPKREWM